MPLYKVFSIALILCCLIAACGKRRVSTVTTVDGKQIVCTNLTLADEDIDVYTDDGSMKISPSLKGIRLLELVQPDRTKRPVPGAVWDSSNLRNNKNHPVTDAHITFENGKELDVMLYSDRYTIKAKVDDIETKIELKRVTSIENR